MSALPIDKDPASVLTEPAVAEVAGDPYTPVEMATTIATGVLALLIAGLMPLLLAALSQEGRLSASGIGLAAMLEALSTGLVTGLAGIVLKPRGLRPVAAIATLALVAVDLATTRASGGGVLAMRALAGLPEGLLLWIAIGLISRTATPERWAAALFTGMGVTQLAVASLMSAWILPRFGANGGYVAVACGVALCLPLAAGLPKALGGVPGQEAGGGGAPPLKGWLALFGTLCLASSLSAVAVYVVPLALQAALGVGVGRLAISVGLGCQILGGLLATAIAGRIRFIAVFAVTGSISLATWLAYGLHGPAWLFVGMTGLAGMAAMVAGPFLVPMTIEADPTRRAAMQSGAVQLLAGALGPLLSALVVRPNDARGVLVMAAGLQLLGLAVAFGLHRLSAAERRRQRVATIT